LSSGLYYPALDTAGHSYNPLPQGEMHVDEAILTIQCLADYLQIDEKTVYRMAQAGELPGFKVRRQWRFKRVDIDLWIESRKKTTAATAPNDAPTRAVEQVHPVAVSQRGSLAKNRGR
jgi:excisionase family DNA binding protein